LDREVVRGSIAEMLRKDRADVPRELLLTTVSSAANMEEMFNISAYGQRIFLKIPN
jgi:hypothetical protein